jgi:type IV pilus assembly protein PilB
MHIPDKTVVELIIKAEKADHAKIASLQDQAATEKVTMQELAVRSNVITDLELTKMYAEVIGVPFIDINVKELDREILRQIPEHIAKLYAMVVFDGAEDEPQKSVALEDPDDLQAIDVLHKLFGNAIKIHIATHFNILSAIDQYRGNLSGEISKAITEGEETEEESPKIRPLRRPLTSF